jgi:hypothetical protein
MNLGNDRQRLFVAISGHTFSALPPRPDEDEPPHLAGDRAIEQPCRLGRPGRSRPGRSRPGRPISSQSPWDRVALVLAVAIIAGGLVTFAAHIVMLAALAFSGA